LQIQIVFPKPVLVQAVWWSAYYKDDTHGYITSIGKLYFKYHSSDGWTIIDTSSILTRTEEGGKSNMPLIYLPVPILAIEMRYIFLTYTGNPVGSNPLPNYDDGHFIMFEAEVFGCDNYIMNEGKQGLY
jgi:hypothetical protein